MSSQLIDAKERFIRAGGNLQHKNVQRLLEIEDTRAEDAAKSLSAPPNAEAARRIVWALGWLAVIFFQVVLVVGVALLLIIIPLAEFAAVYNGLITITDDQRIVGLTTGAIFIGTIVLMFLHHVYEDKLPNGIPHTSMRRTLSRVAVSLGYTDARKWDQTEPHTKLETAYLRLHGALNFAKFGILFASLLGRLQNVITAHANKPLGDAIMSISTEITGTEFIGAVVSLIILFAIIRILDTGVLFVYTSFKNTAGNIDLAEARPVDFLEVYTGLREEYQAQRLNDMSLQLEQRANNEEDSTETGLKK